MTIHLKQAASVATGGHSPTNLTASQLILPPGAQEINIERNNLLIEALFREANDLYEQEKLIVSLLTSSGVSRPAMHPEAIRLNREARREAALARSIWRMMESRGLPVYITPEGFFIPPAECTCNGTAFDPPNCHICTPHNTEIPW